MKAAITFINIVCALNLISCSTIQNRSKPLPIEHFNTNYEKIHTELVGTNSFAFIFNNTKYYFNLAHTYLNQGPQLYYLGYKNESLAYIIRAEDVSLLKEIFQSKDLLYKKTQRILNKLDELNLYPAKSVAFDIKPKHSILYDLTDDTMNFLVYGAIAVAGIPWVVGGYAEYLSEKRDHKKLDEVRLGMDRKKVDELLTLQNDSKPIDQYKVEIFSSKESRSYMNALFIFENNLLVGMIRSTTKEPITDYYKTL